MKKLIFLISLLSVLFSQNKNNQYNYLNELISDGNHLEAISEINKILKKDSLNHNLYFIKGKANFGILRYDESLKDFQKAYSLDSNVVYSYFLAQNYNLLDNSKEAEKYYLYTINNNPKNISAKINIGTLYVENGIYDKAINQFEDLIKIDSSNIIYYKNLGFAYAKNKKDSLAISIYRKGLRIKKEDVTLSLNLAQLFYASGKIDSAYRVIIKSSLYNRTNAKIHRFIGDISLEKKNYFLASDSYKIAIENGDTSFSTYKNAGISCYFTSISNLLKVPKEMKEDYLFLSEQYLLKALEKNEKDILTTYYLAVVYKNLKNYEKAEMYLSSALELMVPEYITTAYLYYGEILSNLNQHQKAIENLNKIYFYNKDHIQAKYYLANVYDKMGNTKLAIKNYEDFIKKETDKENVSYKFSIERIEKLKEKQFFNGEK